jgi:excisionase family DNA binding protein
MRNKRKLRVFALSTQEAADYLGVSVSGVKWFIEKERLTARKLAGGCWAIEPHSLERLKKEREKEGATAFG